MDWLESLVLGLVQGVTEFLPVSSDGHLVLTQQIFAWFRGVSRPPSEDVFVDVMLHLGTTVAILLHYRKTIGAGVRGILGRPDVPDDYRRRPLLRLASLIAVAGLPLGLDVLFKKKIEAAFEGLLPVGLGFLVSAVMLLLIIRLRHGDKGPQETTYLDALLIGLAQSLAPLPGVSRSGLTVATALARGFRGTWAVGFSFLIGVPAIFGAVGLKLRDVDLSAYSTTRLSQIALATVVAGVAGYGAIVWLLRIVRSRRLWYFSVYLIVLAMAVLSVHFLAGAPTDARRETALDRAFRAGPVQASDGVRRRRPGLPLDRPVSARSGSTDPRPQPAPGGGERPPRPVLGRFVVGGATRAS